MVVQVGMSVDGKYFYVNQGHNRSSCVRIWRIENDRLHLVYDTDVKLREVLAKAHVPFTRGMDGSDAHAEYGCTFALDGRLAAVVRAGKWVLVDLESENVIRQGSFSLPNGTRPTVRINETAEVLVFVRSVLGRHVYRWNPAETEEPEELSSESLLPADNSGEFLEEQTSHLGVSRSEEISGRDSIADICAFDATGSARTLCSYIASGGISFMGITPDGNRIVIGDHCGDVAVCSIEDA